MVMSKRNDAACLGNIEAAGLEEPSAARAQTSGEEKIASDGGC